MSVGEFGFIGERLTEAREARGLNQAELASLVDLRRASISHYEGNKRSPDAQILSKLAVALEVPDAFFFKDVDAKGGDSLFYRSLASVSKTDRKKALRRYGWLKELASYLRGFVRLPRVNLPQFEVSNRLTDIDSDMVASYASRTRAFWGLGRGPISDVMLLLENNGVIVSKAVFETRHMDAYSSFNADSATPYVIIAYDKGSAVRSRFDLAHELGHMVLHKGLAPNVVNNPSNHKAIEAQANAFAGELLLPADSFTSDLGVVSLDALKPLKRRWRVSIGVMLYRLSELGLLTEDQSTRFWKNYSRRGWRTGEPLDDSIEPESPKLLRRGVELIVEKGVRQPSEIVSELCLPAKDLCELACLAPNFFTRVSSSDTEVRFRAGGGDVGKTVEYGIGKHFTPQSLN